MRHGVGTLSRPYTVLCFELCISAPDSRHLSQENTPCIWHLAILLPYSMLTHLIIWQTLSEACTIVQQGGRESEGASRLRLRNLEGHAHHDHCCSTRWFSMTPMNMQGIVQVAAVDCDDNANKKLCGKSGIQGFPTIKASCKWPCWHMRMRQCCCVSAQCSLPTSAHRVTPHAQHADLSCRSPRQPLHT